MIARLLISPNLETRVGEIDKILSQTGITPNHPDLLYFPYDSKLGIADARKIKMHFSLKPYSAKERTVVLEDASTLTIEAQNALLKILEEPPQSAILILAAPSDAKLLPTILSRCQITRLIIRPTVSTQHTPGVYNAHTVEKDIDKLLNSTIEERFEYIEKLKDREEFLHAIVYYFHKNLHAPRPGLARLEVKTFLQELLQAEEWAAQNVNIRAILEYLMLRMPSKYP